jgi:hypothetical protein
MASDVQSPPEPGVVATLKGILTDFQELTRQQFALFRAEMHSDWTRTRDAVLTLVVGIAPLFVGVIQLCWMLVYLLHWLTSPAGSDPASLPLWACFGIVGGILSLVGAGLIFMGVKKLQSFNPLPDQSVHALQENVRWLTNPK